jgi:hypothetical protein
VAERSGIGTASRTRHREGRLSWRPRSYQAKPAMSPSGPSRHIAPPHKLDRSQGKAGIANAALNMWLMSTGEAPAFLAVVAALTALALAA